AFSRHKAAEARKKPRFFENVAAQDRCISARLTKYVCLGHQAVGAIHGIEVPGPRLPRQASDTGLQDAWPSSSVEPAPTWSPRAGSAPVRGEPPSPRAG